MSLNLVRNSKVFFTTNVNTTTGKINPAGGAGGVAFTSSNTFQLLVLDGFSFSQNVNNETVTVSEAGSTPTRGQRSFNTSLAPVDFSFSTYIRPSQLTSGAYTIECDESVLWNALFSSTEIAESTLTATAVTAAYATTGTITLTATTGTFASPPAVDTIVQLGGIGVSGGDAATVKQINGVARVTTSTSTSVVFKLLGEYPGTAQTLSLTSNTVKYAVSSWHKNVGANDTTAFSSATSATSEKNQLQKFGLLFLVDNVLYAVDNCALNQVTIDFGIDQIATAQWTGQATAIRELSRAVTVNSGGTGFSGGQDTDVGAAGAFKTANNSANFITNKLSTAKLVARKAIGSSVSAGNEYIIPITGGSVTINNNITYITPANLGVINLPITYFTGVRSITGTLNAYLRTPASGTTNTGELFKDMITEASAGTTSMIEPMFSAGIQIGGSGNAVRVELDMPTISLSVPSINVEQIVSVAMNFTAQGASGTTFDLTQPNELTVSYYA